MNKARTFWYYLCTIFMYFNQNSLLCFLLLLGFNIRFIHHTQHFFILFFIYVVLSLCLYSAFSANNFYVLDDDLRATICLYIERFNINDKALLVDLHFYSTSPRNISRPYYSHISCICWCLQSLISLVVIFRLLSKEGGCLSQVYPNASSRLIIQLANLLGWFKILSILNSVEI